MEGKQVRYRVESGKAILTIDREPSRNALSRQVLEELSEGIRTAQADVSARVIVLTGAGDKVFSAGGDLGGMGGEEGFFSAHDARSSYGRLVRQLEECGRPSIARVNGHALGGGLGLALACDLAVATDTAQLGTPEIDLGLFPMMVMALLHRHLGRKRALELIMTGERIGAPEALALGLLNRVVPAAQLDSAVDSLASKIAGKSQAALRLGRRAFFASEDMPFGPSLDYLAAQLSVNACLEDAAEGVAAFLEKRKPAWRDR
jgi:enoyl-CoA hydratase/carnithine racemase